MKGQEQPAILEAEPVGHEGARVAIRVQAVDRRGGMASLILYRPVSRAAYLLSGAMAGGGMVLIGLTLGAAAAFYYTALLFSGARLGPFVLINVGVLRGGNCTRRRLLGAAAPGGVRGVFGKTLPYLASRAACADCDPAVREKI